MQRYQVVIIGGGVIGASIARYLSRFQVKTLLLEREMEVGFGVSKANSGIVHAGHHSPPELLKGQFVVEGNAAFPQLAKELGFGFKTIGELVVAFDAKERETLLALKANGEAKGMRDLVMWDRETIRKKEPNLSAKIKYALFAPSAGVVNPYELTMTLAAHAEENGVELSLDSRVTAIRKHELSSTFGRPNWIVTYEKSGQKIEIESQFIVNAAGLYADKIAAMIGDTSFSIHPRRGEEYLLSKKKKGLIRHLIFPVPNKKSKGTLIIPTFDGSLIVGPTADEIDDREAMTTSAEAAARIFASVKKMCPQLSERDSLAQFAGLRNAADSGDFIIGEGREKGFFNVAGIQSPGLTASPAIARVVTEMLVSAGLKLDDDPQYNPILKRRVHHFNLVSRDEQLALLKRNQRYALNVCRCENISAAEVEEALEQGAKTLDGIKFRTRVGMGGCQGGFCTMPTIEIAAEKLGIKPTAFFKNSPQSWIMMERNDED